VLHPPAAQAATEHLQVEKRGTHCRLAGLVEAVERGAVIGDAELRERIIQAADTKMAQKAANFGPDVMRYVERSLLLQILDQTWKDHLLSLDHLRQGINLRAYAQRDPLNEYKREAFELFQEMLSGLREQVTSVLCRVEVRAQPTEAELAPPPRGPMIEGRTDPAMAEAEAAEAGVRGTSVGAGPAPWSKTPRNAACPCGSGKKYKHCHGRI